ncbi:MAG: DUF3450 family protein [Myxococcales bacterium]|nr:DUF3450 family protein [Myxococcales bacterium]
MHLHPALRGLPLALGLLAAGSAWAAPPVAERARALASLRRQIGLLEAELRSERDRGGAELAVLAQRTAQLEAQIAATKAHVAEHKAAVARAEAADADRAQASAALRAAVAQGAAALTAAIDDGLPYRRAERRAAVEQLDAAVQAQRVAAAEGAARLWRLAEDELRLAGEIARTATPVALSPNGPPRLVEAVKLGTVVLLTRLPEGGFGWLRRVDGVWRHDPLPAEADADEVARLFTDLDKRVRGGLYRLPVPGATP